jgi:hypothetical protein
VSGISKTHLQPLRQRNDLIIAHWLEAPERFFRIFRGVKGNRFSPSGPFAFTILPLSFHLLNTPAILEHHFTEIKGRLGANDLASESFLDQSWDETAVVDVGMGE